MHFSRARLRGHRSGLGLSQAELAERVGGVAGYYLGQIEAGDCEPDAAMISRLATALGLQSSDLYGSGSWDDEYIAAALQHALPMPAEDIARAAAVLAAGVQRRAA